jgi:hypothetical protein
MVPSTEARCAVSPLPGPTICIWLNSIDHRRLGPISLQQLAKCLYYEDLTEFVLQLLSCYVSQERSVFRLLRTSSYQNTNQVECAGSYRYT